MNTQLKKFFTANTGGGCMVDFVVYTHDNHDYLLSINDECVLEYPINSTYTVDEIFEAWDELSQDPSAHTDVIHFDIEQLRSRINEPSYKELPLLHKSLSFIHSIDIHLNIITLTDHTQFRFIPTLKEIKGNISYLEDALNAIVSTAIAETAPLFGIDPKSINWEIKVNERK